MANLQEQIFKPGQGIGSFIASIIKIARPIHWVKNLALFAALIFTGHLFDKILFNEVFLAFISFSLATSSTYILNDILDAKTDMLHPIKKFRPIASGKVSVPVALVLSVILALVSIYLAEQLGSLFFSAVIFYLGVQVLYSFILKNIAILDILVIASGFVVRVYAGAFVINAHLSVWFLLCVISVSLFLASGKRRAEFGALSGTNLGETRKSLSKYSKTLLDSYVTMFGNAAWLSWALFTFFESPSATQPVWLFLAEISKATTISKLLMITIPIVIFGIMRYESLIFEDRSEAPEKLLLTDKSLMAAATIWGLLITLILYGGLSTLA